MQEVMVREHCCPCCGRSGVKEGYDYCYICMMKWLKVYRSCLGYGWNRDSAIKRADESYPRKYDNAGKLLV